MQFYQNKSSTELIKEYLIPKGKDLNTKYWTRILINYKTNEFTGKKVIIESISKDWQVVDDYTFPSSLFNQFLREAEYTKEENA